MQHGFRGRSCVPNLLDFYDRVGTLKKKRLVDGLYVLGLQKPSSTVSQRMEVEKLNFQAGIKGTLVNQQLLQRQGRRTHTFGNFSIQGTGRWYTLPKGDPRLCRRGVSSSMRWATGLSRSNVKWWRWKTTMRSGCAPSKPQESKPGRSVGAHH